MTIEDQIKDENYNMILIERQQKYHLYHQAKLLNMNTLLVKKYCHRINDKLLNKLHLLILLWEKLLKNRQKQLKIKGKKQIKAIQDKSIKKIKKYSDYDNDYKKELLISKEREIFRDIYNDRLEQIQLGNRNVDYNNLNYEVITSGDEYQFNGLEDLLVFLKEIKEGKILIQEAKNTQKEFNKQLNLIRRGSKNQEQRQNLNNINNLYNARDMAIKFIEDYGSMILEAKKNSKTRG